MATFYYWQVIYWVTMPITFGHPRTSTNYENHRLEGFVLVVVNNYYLLQTKHKTICQSLSILPDFFSWIKWRQSLEDVICEGFISLINWYWMWFDNLFWTKPHFHQFQISPFFSFMLFCNMSVHITLMRTPVVTNTTFEWLLSFIW